MISHTYKNMPPSELEVFSALVTTRLENNAIFSTIKQAALADLLPAQTAFSAAKLDFDTHRGTDRSALRETCRLELVKQLFLTSIIVQSFAKTDADIISASGYVLRKTTRPKNSKKEPVSVTPPADFKVTHVDNKPGFINLTWLGVTGARNYGIFRRPMGDTVWMNGIQTSNKSIELSGFQPGSIWEFCVCTYGPGEQKSEQTSAFGILIK